MARRGENIRKRNDGRWEGRYADYRTDGEKIYRSVYARTYTEVKKKLMTVKNKKNFLSEQTLPSYDVIQNAYLSAASEWLNSVKTKRKYSTYVKYRSLYEKYVNPIFSDNVRFQQLLEKKQCCGVLGAKQQRFEICLTEQELFHEWSPSTSIKKSIYTIIRQINKMVSRSGFTGIYFESDVENRKKEGCIEVFTASEQARLLKFLYKDTDIGKMGIILCLFTGIRLGELCALQWRDIDFNTETVHINRTVQRIRIAGNDKKTVLMVTEPKSFYSIREIPVSEKILVLLKHFYSIRRDTDEYIFGGQNPMEPRTYQNRLKKYLSMAEIHNKNFHILRHTFATNCIGNGIDVKSLSEILGHADVKMTLNRYVHPSLELKRKQMELLSSFYGQYEGQ